MPSNKRAGSPASHDNRGSKRARKNTSNKPKKGKKRDRKDAAASESDNEDGSNSETESECDPESDVGDSYGGMTVKDLKGAGRSITRCCDLFCDVNKAIYLVMLSKQEEKDQSGSEDEDEHQARKEALDRITPRMLVRYKKVYSTLIREIPSIKILIDDRSRASTLKIVLRKINEAISETRSSDTARLREKIPSYILQNPKVDTVKPAINSSTLKSELGLNHLQLAGFLCPVEFIAAFNGNAKETRKNLENGKIDMSPSELPAFLWEENGKKYSDDDILSGLFRGFYLERVARHVFTGPSTAHGGDSRGARSCNAVLHNMESVEAAHIAYAAARFGISSQLRWSEKDGRFNYRKFYYIIMDLIDECEDAQWKEDVLKHYNMLFFKNEDGRGADFTAVDDESATTSTSKPKGFLNRMRAQAAARAADTIKPPPQVPINNTPPATSPPSAQAAAHTTDNIPPPVSPPSATDPEVTTASVHEPPEPSPIPQQLPSPNVPPQPPVQPPPPLAPATLTHVDTTFLDLVSDLSEIEPEDAESSAKPGNNKKNSSARKGKRKVTKRSSEGGSSRRKNPQRKGGTDA